MDQGHLAYIGLGSNLGDRRASITGAAARLERTEGIDRVSLSSLWKTEPVGGPAGQGLFLNGAARLETGLTPLDLLATLLAVERVLGRRRVERWGPRIIDLDLLLFDDQVIRTEQLVVPHPLMHQRRFVLGPLAEIAGDVVHPLLGRTVAELWRDLDAQG